MRLTLKFEVTVDGDTMTGTSKAPNPRLKGRREPDLRVLSLASQGEDE